MVLSIIGGLFILGIGAVILWIAAVFESLLAGLLPLGAEGLGVDPVLWLQIIGGVFGVAFGLIIMLGGVMMFVRPQSSTLWGVIILVLSVLSIISTGGIFLGLILGVIGGILGIVFKPTPAMPAPAPAAMPPPVAPAPEPAPEEPAAPSEEE